MAIKRSLRESWKEEKDRDMIYIEQDMARMARMIVLIF